MDLQLTDKVALVVGAAGSMGAAVLAALSREGAHVLAADLPGRLDTVAAAQTFPIDVTDPDSVAETVRAAHAHRGRLDILVVLAGIYQAGSVVETKPDDWDRVVDVNLKGTFLLAREVLPLMQASDYGRIVVLASLAGQVGGVVAGPHYSASKAGVLCLVKSLAKQTREPFITVNAISPGPVTGNMTDNWPAADKQTMIDKIPLRRFGEPTEIADLVSFLASPRAAYIHGARVDINGGVHCD